MNRGVKRGFIITAVALVVMTLALIFLDGLWLVATFVLGAAACVAFPPIEDP